MIGRKPASRFAAALLTAACIAVLIVVCPQLALLLLLIGALVWIVRRLFGWKSRQARGDRLLAYPLEKLDGLSGSDFEEWVTAVLVGAGIPAKNIQHRGDFGVDVVATVDGTRIGIQVKRFSGSVGNSAVQQALAGSGYHDCSLAAVVTQSKFTRAAREQASRARVPVLLVDRDLIYDLPKLLTDFAKEA